MENSETQDWIFPYTLDYIHLRAMMTCFNDFQAVMHKSYDHMTTGGWIELYDGSWDFQCMDGSAQGTALEQWANLLYLGGLRAGRDMRRARHYKQYLLNAGFVDVDDKVVWCPGSPWPADPRHKEIGWFMMENVLGMIDAHGKFLESAGLSPAEIEQLCSEARRDARNLGIHWFVPVCVPAPFCSPETASGHFKADQDHQVYCLRAKAHESGSATGGLALGMSTFANSNIAGISSPGRPAGRQNVYHNSGRESNGSGQPTGEAHSTCLSVTCRAWDSLPPQVRHAVWSISAIRGMHIAPRQNFRYMEF